MAKRITNFLVKYRKGQRKKQLLIWKGSETKDIIDVDLSQDFSFIMGYQYDGLNGIDGEYILLKDVGEVTKQSG